MKIVLDVEMIVGKDEMLENIRRMDNRFEWKWSLML